MPPTKLFFGQIQGVRVPAHVEQAIQQMVADGRRVADVIRVALIEYVAREARKERRQPKSLPDEISDEEILQRR